MLSCSLFLILLAILIWGPLKNAIDTKWVIPTAMSLIHGNAGDISEYTGGDLRAVRGFGDRVYSDYPIGTPLLTMPAVILFDLVVPDFNEKVKSLETATAEKTITSIFGALTGVIFFWVIYSRFRDVTIAFVSTFVLIFCTSMWSTATRALWSQGPMVLTIVLAMLVLLRARTRAALAQYASLPLAMAFTIRPSAVAPIAAISLYVFLAYRAYFIKYLAWSAAIAVPWIAFNLWSFGAPFPDYYLLIQTPSSISLWQGMAVQLVSPARGLFVFSPILLFALGGFVLAIRGRDDLGLNLTFAECILLHLLIVARFPCWWAGWSFGPRFMIEALPFLVYFFAFVVRAIVPIDNLYKVLTAAAVSLFAAASLLIHAQGAYTAAAGRWNVVPVDIDKKPERIWDWSDLQFTRGIPFINPEPKATAERQKDQQREL